MEHPARAARVELNGKPIGRIAELLNIQRAAVLDLDLTQLAPAVASYKPINRYPASAFDLSIVTEERILAATLRQQIEAFASDVEYVREYKGENVPAGKKSVTFRITARAADHTLTNEEITALRNRIIEGLTKQGHDLKV